MNGQERTSSEILRDIDLEVYRGDEKTFILYVNLTMYK